MGKHTGAESSRPISPRPGSGRLGVSGGRAQHLEGKGQEIRRAAGASRQGFPGLSRRRASAGPGAKDPLRGAAVWKPRREAGGCGARAEAAREPREDPGGRGVGGARSPAPRPRPGHRGRCRLSNAQLRRRRREAEPGVPRGCPASSAVRAAHPGSRDCLGAAETQKREERERDWRRRLSPRVRGAREAERRAGWPPASVLARPESCGAEDRHPERPPGLRRAAGCAAAAQTHTHREPPSATEPPPPPPAARRRASGCGIQSQVPGWRGAQSTA
ncbi:uncharacterized protein LOC127230935 [Phodopus roborovskii]|uniref:uncharacterized protein LOC127230935 n=1 Tax=Phodopus roborovskii TaxID=109678 RepID=UPI0021E3DF03|nr:uncharacterized protein LOC127230935 [Phodopus roborovskii]